MYKTVSKIVRKSKYKEMRMDSIWLCKKYVFKVAYVYMRLRLRLTCVLPNSPVSKESVVMAVQSYVCVHTRVFVGPSVNTSASLPHLFLVKPTASTLSSSKDREMLFFPV